MKPNKTLVIIIWVIVILGMIVLVNNLKAQDSVFVGFIVIDPPVFIEWGADSIKTTHYYNGATPEHGTIGELIEWYDGCNWHERWSNNVFSSTAVCCEFKDGAKINTWHKYKISEKEYAIIHDSYIYHDPNIKRW